MQKLCSWKPPGETVGELGEGYVNNTICGQKYEAQLDKQIEYHRKMQEALKERKGNGK